MTKQKVQNFHSFEEDRLSETDLSGPPSFVLNVFTALKVTHFYILFVVTAAGVVPYDSLKKRPRTSSIVQYIFYFWSFEISRNILEISENIIFLDSYILNSLNYLNLIWIYINHCMTLLKLEITV